MPPKDYNPNREITPADFMAFIHHLEKDLARAEKELALHYKIFQRLKSRQAQFTVCLN